jgi:hypothetical protein
MKLSPQQEIDWFNRHHKLNFCVGQRIRYFPKSEYPKTQKPKKPIEGVIVGASDIYLKIIYDGHVYVSYLHPFWHHIELLELKNEKS